MDETTARTCESMTREELLVYVQHQNWIIARLVEEVEYLMPVRGRAGGRAGGLARAAKLTAGERSEACRKAANARWAAVRKGE